MSDAQSTSAEKSKKRRSGHYCCVTNCHNHDLNTKLFRFPKRNHEQRELWVKAVNRKNADGSGWMPTDYSKICSAHFCGEKPSPTRFDINYMPTLFPPVEDGDRSEVEHPFASSIPDDDSKVKIRDGSDIGVQTSSEDIPGESYLFSFRISPTEAMTQVNTVRKPAGGIKVPRQTASSMTPLIFYTSTSSGLKLPPSKKICKSTKDVDVQTEYYEDSGESYLFCLRTCSTEVTTQVNTGKSVIDGYRAHRSGDVSEGCSLNLSSLEDREFIDYTGVSRAIFNCILLDIGDSLKDSIKLTRVMKLQLVLVKLKRNIPYVTLAKMFGVDERTVSHWFKSGVHILYNCLKFCVRWLEKDEADSQRSREFCSKFPRARAVIDIGEIVCERPCDEEKVISHGSVDNSNYTIKFLFVISPCGDTMYITEGYPGCTPNSEISLNSEFMERVEFGDEFLAVKEFHSVRKQLEFKGSFLITPLYEGEKIQRFLDTEFLDEEQSLSVRLHASKAIERMKRFEIFNYIHSPMMEFRDKVLVIVSGLCNLCNDVIYEN